MCVKIFRNCHFYCFHSNFLIMPKYAVAVGRCTGIYETYDECKKQILNYPNAKYKKFNTAEEAQAFILKFGKTSISNSAVVGTHFRVENENPPELFQINKSPRKNASLNDIYEKLSHLDEKFTEFVSNTNTTFNDIKIRLLNLETSLSVKSHCDPTRPTKRIKLEDPESYERCDSLFLKNENDIVIVYTDGACSNNGKSGARAGIGVWFNRGHPLNVSAPLRGPATNNNAEIQAARVAINQAAKGGVNKLCIHTDSQFLINCITGWINKWKKNNWKCVNGEDVKNKVELVKLDSALQELESVEWVHVKGHVGVEGNEMADKLARDGAALYKVNVTYSDYSDL